MSRRLSSWLVFSVLAIVTGCSGAEPSDLFGPEGNNGGAAAKDTSASGSDATSDSPSATGPSQTDPPAPAKPDPGASGTDPNDPTQTCAAESLDNDEFRTADPFDSCIAGKLIGKDVDYVTVVAPADATEVSIKHTESGGKVAYRVFVDGYSTVFTDTPPASIPAVPDGKYTFKIEPSGTYGDRSWQLEVTFQ